MSTLTLQGVSLSRGAVEFVTNLDLTVRSPEVVAVVGTKDSGKTTLLRAIAAEHAGGRRSLCGSFSAGCPRAGSSRRAVRSGAGPVSPLA